MGNTDWGDVLGTGISVAGGLIGADQASDAAEMASKNYTQDALKLAERQNEWNRSNMAWSRDQNREIANENFLRNLGALQYNRPDQQSSFGSTTWEQGDDGTITQQTSLPEELQGALGTLRGQYDTGISNLDMDGFGVNDPVMGAMRELQAPGIQQAEDAQRARYAAMGIPIQSTAMDRGESNLADARSRADLDAILAGNQAWQSGQSNLRSNLGTMADLETSWRGNSVTGNPGFTQLGVPLQGQVGSATAPSLGNIAGTASNVGNLAGQATGSSWANAAQGVGNIASDIWSGI